MLEGAVAQLGERLVCNQEATGSIPVSSTNEILVVGGRPMDLGPTTKSPTTNNQRDVGRQCDDRESVHDSMEVAWRRTLGWMDCSE